MQEITRLGDIGTPERHERKELTTAIIEGFKVGKVRKISPIDYYYNRGELDAAQLSAGNKLYNYYITACVGYGNCEHREKIDGTPKAPEATEKQVHARLQYDKGIKATKKYRQVIDDIVLNENFISNIVQHWYTRKKMKEQLRIALTELAKTYGITS
jgi:hypothetical protein